MHIAPARRSGIALAGTEVFMSPKIFIVDDHDVVRQGVRLIISKARPGWEICGEAADGENAIKGVVLLDPDVVILDVTMPVMNGLQAASEILARAPRSRILILTMHESERLCADLRDIGVHGYVQKSQAGRDLVLAIDRLLRGGTFFEFEVEAKPEPSGNPNPGISFCVSLLSPQPVVIPI
jgi:DNA-binding NarL/FixJ family response regulator